MSAAERRGAFYALSKTKHRGVAAHHPASIAMHLVAAPLAVLLPVTVPALAVEAKPTPRLVSLAPSNTELLIEAGAEKSIVGVCSNCATHLPTAGALLKGKPVAGSFVSVNLERMARLKPDAVLIVSGQEAIASMLKKHGFNVVLLNNNKLTDIPANLAKIGSISQTEGRAKKLASIFCYAMADLSAIIGSTKSRPKVFYCVWPQPLLTIGKASFLNDVITVCGGKNIADDLQQSYPHFSAERLVIADPDVIVLPYEAKDMEVFKRFPWNKLRAVRENRLFYLPAPKDDLLARPTMNVLEGLYWLTTRIHPELEAKLKNWHSSNNIITQMK